MLLKKQADNSALGINKYIIICQISQTAILTSTKNGRIKVIEVAHIRNDIVLWRLQDLAVEENFQHRMTNARYKSYTTKKALDAIMVGFLKFLSSLFCMFLLFFCILVSF